MVLTDDNFSTIVKAVELGRGLYDNLVKYVRFQMGCLFGFIVSFLGASIFNIAGGVPFLPLQTLWINFTTLLFQAIGLGYGQPAGSQQTFGAGSGVDPFLGLLLQFAADFLGFARFFDPALKLGPAMDQRLVGDVGPPSARLEISDQSDEAVAGQRVQDRLETDRIVTRAELCDRLLTPRVGSALTELNQAEENAPRDLDLTGSVERTSDQFAPFAQSIAIRRPSSVQLRGMLFFKNTT